MEIMLSSVEYVSRKIWVKKRGEALFFSRIFEWRTSQYETSRHAKPKSYGFFHLRGFCQLKIRSFCDQEKWVASSGEEFWKFVSGQKRAKLWFFFLRWLTHVPHLRTTYALRRFYTSELCPLHQKPRTKTILVCEVLVTGFQNPVQ